MIIDPQKCCAPSILPTAIHRVLTLFFAASLTIGFFLYWCTPLGTRPLFYQNLTSDFSFYLATIAGFLVNGSPGIANPTAIIHSINVVLGDIIPPNSKPLPNHITPSAIVIWAPLLLPLQISLNAAYCSWLGISWGTVIVALRRTWTDAAPQGLFSATLFLLAIVVACASPPTLICVDIGQTTIFGIGITALLIQHLTGSRSGLAADCGAGALLFLLSLKAHYFVVGGSLLVMERRWRALTIGLILTVGAIFICDPLGNYGLIRDFLSTIVDRSITGEMKSQEFFGTNFHTRTPTWLSISSGLVSDSTRTFVNNVAVGIGALLYALLFLRGSNLHRRSRLTAASALVVGVYLCFAPYLSTYDQLLIVIPLLASVSPGCLDSTRAVLLVLLGLFVTLSNANASAFVWATKLLLLGALAVSNLTFRGKGERPRVP